MIRNGLTTLLFLPILSSAPVLAQDFVVTPYLQTASPSSMRILWETTEGEDSVVEWGVTPELSQMSTGSSFSGLSDNLMHEVRLEGLSPATRYYYRASTGSAVSEIQPFTTPPAPDSESAFRIVLMSDMQSDGANPLKYDEIVHDGILSFVEANYSEPPDQALALVMTAGDLVSDGWNYSLWQDDFFAPGADLMATVPFYPVIGNHEADSPFYFQYFSLPENGSEGTEEHWWSTDYSNLRIIGLDTNGGYRTQAQLDWLDATLDDACANDNIDFVFAQMHHPFHSELWPTGNTDFTGRIISRLEDFSTRCGKPSVHFFGHTHGYSRGQSQDHTHLMVDVATAGGNPDYWGEYEQIDYPEYSLSQDEWGFVLVEVEAGDDPRLRLRRISRGNEDLPRDNEVRDDITLRRYNSQPETPIGLHPSGEDINPDCTQLEADSFLDMDGDWHAESQWQLSLDCENFNAPLFDQWRNYQNWFNNEDTRAGDDLTDELAPQLLSFTDYCWRVRYRDDGLTWSSWSDPVPFTTGASSLTENLLSNSGAEDGIEDWTVVQGTLESLPAGQCGGTEPYEGQRYFVVGGICDPQEFGEVVQAVDISIYLSEIDAGQAKVRFGGFLSNFKGEDQPRIEVVFRGEDGSELGHSMSLESTEPSWTEVSGLEVVPVGARTLDFVLTGTRNAGDDNDCYFDELYLQLDLSGEDSCSSAPEDPDPGCGGDGLLPYLGLLALAAIKRRD